MEKVLPLIDFSTSQEIAESWYLDKSEDESEEGLDDNMMAYVHQAEEILKEGAHLLQKHQTMKTEVPYGDMFSSFEYAKSSNPHEHNTVKQEPTQRPPPGPSGVSSQTSKYAPSRQYSIDLRNQPETSAKIPAKDRPPSGHSKHTSHQ